MGPTRPQIVLYEAPPNGAPKLTGADFLVYADAWDAIHPGVTPQLMDRSSITSRPQSASGSRRSIRCTSGRGSRIPRAGAFVNWHPKVSCQSFVGQTTP